MHTIRHVFPANFPDLRLNGSLFPSTPRTPDPKPIPTSQAAKLISIWIKINPLASLRAIVSEYAVLASSLFPLFADALLVAVALDA